MPSIRKTALPINASITLLALALLRVASLAHSETLDEAFVVALAADTRLAASTRQTAAARSGLDAAKGLALPKVSVDALYNHLSDTPAFQVDIPPLPATSLPFAQDRGWVYRAGVTVPLYTSGRLTSAAKAADATLGAAEVDTRRTEQDIKLDVAGAYVTVLRAQRQLELADSGVRTLQQHETDVSLFFERGLVAENDLLAARSAAANAQQDRIRAGTALEIARSTYNRQLGRALTMPVDLADLKPDPGGAPTPAGAAPERAELVALTRQTEALRHQADAARAAAGPQIVLSGGYDRLQNRYLANDGLWNVTVGLRWALFDGSVSRNQGAALDASADALAETRADAESRIALQVRAAGLMVDESRSRIGVAERAVEQADENLQVARDRYQSGVGTNTEVLDAETLRLKSRSNHFNAIYDNVFAVQRYKRARGEL